MSWRRRWNHFFNFSDFDCCRPNYGREFPMYTLPKPREASDITDGIPFIDSESDTDILIVRHIDPKIDINGSLHHTAKYELMMRDFEPALVVRRGQSFLLDIVLNRPYNDTDGISFIFTVEDDDKPTHGSGSLVAIPLSTSYGSHRLWNAVLSKTDLNTISVEITPSSECIVSSWKMDVDTKSYRNRPYSYTWSTRIFILFNPWCLDDTVYMDSNIWREEAVLEDVGLIWRGTANRMRPTIWKYGQFDKDVLECSLYLIKYIGKVMGKGRSCPIQTSRALAAAVNSMDDNGALMGNWSNDFEDGTPPTKWVGSAEILQKYYKKKKSVKYAQCWVFGGVLSTICRAVGIPSRPVTNYSSAHDTHSSLTVDYFMTDKGEIMAEMNSDSIWNFHVWNEAWMDRPDLGDGYGGWQAIDATPQEQSDDMYKCGPASVVAVKRGEIKKPYDNSFLYAEVNADKVYWRYDGPTQPLKLIRKDTESIGKQISTKDAGRFERLDLTASYKYPEKTTEERGTMFAALKEAENMFSRYYLNEEFNDIYFNFELNDDIIIGQPFKINLLIRNKSLSRDYQIIVYLRAEVVTYMGKLGDAVKKEDYKFSLAKSTMKDLQLTVRYDEYYKRLLDQAAFNISALAKIVDIDYEYYAQDDFRVRKPDVKILTDNPIEDAECHGTAYLINPLPIALHKCVFRIEGPGISDTLKVKDAVSANGGKATVEFSFTPKKIGRHTIAAKFSSKELDDCDGYRTIYVSSNDIINETITEDD